MISKITASKFNYGNHEPEPDNITVVVIPPDTSIAQFHQNHLKFIPAGYFQNLSNLVQINLGSNEISLIEEYSFIGIQSLQILRLGKNKLACITRHMFSGLASLTELEMYNNEISSIEQNSFQV